MVLFSWKIGGSAGDGSFATGLAMAKMFTRTGYFAVGYPEYPSLIKGGHNTYQVVIDKKPVHSPVQTTDIVVALNKDAIFFHKDNITKNGALIYDEQIDISKFPVRADILKVAVPFLKIITENNADQRMKNVICIGASLALIDYPMDILEEIIRDTFGKKGEEVVQKNLAVAKAGFAHVKAVCKTDSFPKKIKKLGAPKQLMITGNETAGVGSIRAGLTFYSAYPMTPASSVLHYLVTKEYDYDIVVKQTEDEIAAINYAVGAAFAGARSMAGTSGGGFALMVETLGMAAIAETPIVIFLSQRVGPSTGMPTWTEQAELRFALHASQGEFLRVVTAPGDINEMFHTMVRAFNWAEKYQIPVLVLSDKFLSESHFSTLPFDESKIKIERGKIATNLPPLPPMARFKRYSLSKDGVSPRSLPGEPHGLHVASSYEHDETGFSSELFSMRRAQVEKRAAKVHDLVKEMHLPQVYGPAKADVTIITWGSMKLPILDALEHLEGVNLLHFTDIYPMDVEKVSKMLSSCKKTIVLENNSTAQFAGLLRELTGFVPDVKLLKYDGRQFFPEQVIDEVKKIVAGKFKEKEVVCKEKIDHEFYAPHKFVQ